MQPRGPANDAGEITLLKKSIHFAFTASISAFWANAGAMSATTKAIIGAILRMSHGSWLDVRFALFLIGHTTPVPVSPPTAV
jgi:hypothetical protein